VFASFYQHSSAFTLGLAAFPHRPRKKQHAGGEWASTEIPDQFVVGVVS